MIDRDDDDDDDRGRLDPTELDDQRYHRDVDDELTEKREG